MTTEVKEMLEKLNTEWTGFKEKNDAKAKKSETRQRELDEELEKRSKAMDAIEEKMQTRMDELELLAKRNALGNDGESKEVSEHKNAYGKFLRKGSTDGLIELQEKATQIAVDADGGFAVPETLDTNILQLARENSVMRGLCSQMTMGNESYRKLVNLHGTGSGWVGETAARPETATAQLGQFAPTFGEIYANPAATQKSLDDVFFDVEGWLGSEVALEFAEQENQAFFDGNGTNKPLGLFANTFAAQDDDTRAFGTLEKIVSANIGAIDFDDLIDLTDAFRESYLSNASWMMNKRTLSILRKIKDTTGNYIYQPSVVAGTPATLLGYNVVKNHLSPVVAASALSVSFGDFARAYKIIDIRGTRVLRDPFTNKPYVHFYTTKRVGGLLEDSQAVKAIEVRAV